MKHLNYLGWITVVMLVGLILCYAGRGGVQVSPIKDESLYPHDWAAIRAMIRARSGDRCEGSPMFPDCRARNKRPHPVTGSRVVLTVAHLDHDPSNNDPASLRHLCQRCHLNHDHKQHMRNSAMTRRHKKGNRELFEGRTER